ncbi:hypothetical protein BDM02DRAFT_3115927, partial [Thelephora ganbajun]
VSMTEFYIPLREGAKAGEANDKGSARSRMLNQHARILGIDDFQHWAILKKKK